MEDINSPYYLNQNDANSSSLNLIGQQLTGVNYNIWSCAMIVALSVKNKLGFVDGSIPKPEPTFALYGSWVCNNNVVMSWIFNSVFKDIVASIKYSDNASEIW